MTKPQKFSTDEGGKEKASYIAPDYAVLAQTVLREINSAHHSQQMPAGKLPAGLYLVATPIGNRGDITLRALTILAQADLILAEDTRNSGGLLRAYGIKTRLQSCHDHNEQVQAAHWAAEMAAGASYALISDAGMPLLADPGYRVVQAAVAAGVAVTVIPGATALASALALSALPPLPFVFAGFLPPKQQKRRNTLQQWAHSMATLAFYESPQRLVESLRDMEHVFGNRMAAVARELTKMHEECRRAPLAALAAYYEENPPKGEIVVLVAPPEAEQAPNAAAVDDRLREAMEHHSLRDAVKQVMAATGLKRDEVYPRALALQNKNAEE